MKLFRNLALAFAFFASAVSPSVPSNLPPVIPYQFVAPQVCAQRTAGTLSCTTPSGALYAWVRLRGGGGGGGGSNPSAGNGGNAADTTLGSDDAGGGKGGGGNNASPGAGGTVTGGIASLSYSGAAGGFSTTGGAFNPAGGGGIGDGGPGQSEGCCNTPGTPVDGTGTGGSGAPTNGTANNGSGGGAGALVRDLITNPSGTYSCVVGAGGVAGAAGTGTNPVAGIKGASGSCEIDWYFQ